MKIIANAMIEKTIVANRGLVLRIESKNIHKIKAEPSDAIIVIIVGPACNQVHTNSRRRICVSIVWHQVSNLFGNTNAPNGHSPTSKFL